MLFSRIAMLQIVAACAALQMVRRHGVSEHPTRLLWLCLAALARLVASRVALLPAIQSRFPWRLCTSS